MRVVERRNPARRADVIRRVVNALAGTWDDNTFRDLILPPGAAERILKRLAVRGLARVTSSGWSATPLLLSPEPLQIVDAAEADFTAA